LGFAGGGRGPSPFSWPAGLDGGGERFVMPEGIAGMKGGVTDLQSGGEEPVTNLQGRVTEKPVTSLQGGGRKKRGVAVG